MEQPKSESEGMQLRDVYFAARRHIVIVVITAIIGISLTIRFVTRGSDLYKSSVALRIAVSAATPEGGEHLSFARAVAFSTIVLNQALIEAGNEERVVNPSTRVPIGFETRLEGSILSFDIVDSDAERAAKLANAWGNAFIATFKNEFQKSEEQEEILKKKWQQKHDALAALEIESGFKIEMKNGDVAISHPLSNDIDEAKHRIAKINLEVQALQAECDVLEKTSSSTMMVSPPARFQEDLDMQRYSAERRQLESEMAVQRSAADPNKPGIKALEQKLAKNADDTTRLISRILNNLKLERDLKVLESEKVVAALNAMQSLLDVARKKAARISDLQVEELAARRAYEKKLGERDDRNVKVPVLFQSAVVSAEPFKVASRTPFLVSGILFSLAIGIGIAVLRELTDDTVHAVSTISRNFQMLPIGFIPIIKSGSSKECKQINEELLRIYHTICSTAKGKSLVVTLASVHRAAGSTFLVSGFAKIATAVGKPILLVEVDAQECRLSKVLGIQATLATDLKKIGLRDAVSIGDGVFMLSIADAIIDRTHAEALVEEMRRDFAFVVIDTPDVLSSATTLLFSSISDATLLICRSRVTTLPRVKNALDSIRTTQAPNVALVLNALDENDLKNESRSHLGA